MESRRDDRVLTHGGDNLLLEPQILQFLIGQRRKNVRRTEKLAFQGPRLAVSLRVPKRDQAHDRILPASDDDLLAPGKPS